MIDPVIARLIEDVANLKNGLSIANQAIQIHDQQIQQLRQAEERRAPVGAEKKDG